jgi:hypothetical protein
MNALTKNNQTALELIQCYALYSRWARALLLNYAFVQSIANYGDTIHEVLDDIEDQINSIVYYLKQWHSGVDISRTSLPDMNILNVTSPEPQERGVLLVVTKLLDHLEELQTVNEDNEAAKADQLLRLVHRCVLLIDLWYAGEDLTYFAAKLDVK